MSKLVPFGWLTLIAAVGAFAFHFYIQRLERSKKDWPTASAHIQSSEIVKTKRAFLKTSLTSTAPNRDPRYQEDDVWALKMDYSFSVGGQTMLGETATSINYATPVAPGETIPSADMVALANRLRAGSVATVHYDPNNPQENYLIYMESPANRTLLTAAWGLLGLGILLIAVPSLFK